MGHSFTFDSWRSVLGTVNGIFMVGSRYVHKLASSNVLISSKYFKDKIKMEQYLMLQYSSWYQALF